MATADSLGLLAGRWFRFFAGRVGFLRYIYAPFWQKKALFCH